jgi:hypothetical protein
MILDTEIDVPRLSKLQINDSAFKLTFVYYVST